MPEVILDYRPHPITEEGRSRRAVTIEGGATVEEIVAGETRRRTVDMEVLLDGRELETLDVEPGPGSVIALRPRLRGGLGRILGTLAVIAAAVFLPPVLGFAAGTLGAAVVGAAITVVGGLIVNALFPVDEPDIGGGGGGQPDPVFSLAGGSNRARLYEPLPLVLGEHRVFPDLGAREYTEYDGNEQYLYQIYNFGPGDLDISDLRIRSSPATDYREVTTERGDAQGRIALVAGNVDTTAGAALEDTNWITRQTGADTEDIAVDITGRLFRLDDRGGEQEQSVTIEVRWWKVGEQPPASPGVRQVVTNDSRTPVRRTLFQQLPERATWNVSVRRTTDPSDEDRTYDEMTWAALRSYQPDTADYSGQNRLGLKIRASGQLSGRLDRVAALVRQKVPAWNNVADRWDGANVATSNPAALFRWFARGVRVAGRVVAGVGLDDARIDHEGLGRWFEWCDVKGYRCDMVLKPNMTMDAALRLIARRGRATLSWKTGKLGVVYEDEATEAETLISPANIVAGSFSVTWNSEPASDEVVVRYIEPDMDWGWNSVRRNRPGLVGTPQSTSTVTARGITVRDNAAIECNLQAARQHYHRRRLGWRMGREGRDLNVGDVVWITHSLIDSGIAGRLSAAAAAVATLDRAPDGVTGGWVMLRLPDGGLYTSEISAVNGRDLTLADPPIWPGEPQDTIYRLYDDADPPRKARIVSKQSRRDTRFEFAATDEVAAYYALATSDLTAPFPGISDRIPRVVAVQFADRRIRAGSGYAIELQAALTVAGDWRGGIVRAGPNANELAVVDRLVGGDTTASWIVPAYTGQAVEIIPGTEDQPTGPVWRGSWNLRSVPPPPPTGFAVTEKAGNIREFVCMPPDIPDLAGVRIRFSNDGTQEWADMASLADGPIAAFPYLAMKPGGGTWHFEARTQATGGDQSTGVRIQVTLGDIPATFAGNTWHTVTGVPDASLGNDGDFAMRIDAGHVGTLYRKADGAWSEIADLEGADGAQWFSGTAAPTAVLGQDGDWYFRTGDSDAAGTVYRKGGGAWAELFDIGTGRWLSGAGAPASDLGRVGDFYFRTSNGYVYEKTGASTWTFRRDITGPAGINGTLWFQGSGAPAAALGNNGDYYLRTSNNNVYRKSSGTWSVQVDFTGADGDDGAQWFSGSTAPSNSLGSNGDWYFRTGSGSVAGSIYRKASGSWSKQIDIDDGNDGEDGSVWHSGTGFPTGSVGKVGDWYFRTSNGFVYEKTGSSTWTFRRDITGPQGPAGVATLGDGSVLTRHIALSATSDLHAGADNTFSRNITDDGEVALVTTPSIPGGTGFKYMALASVFADAKATVTVRLKRGATTIDSVSGRVGGSSFSQWNAAVADDGAHTSAAAFSVTAAENGGVVTIRGATLQVYIAKR